LPHAVREHVPVGPHEVAELLMVKRATVDKWRSRGVMPAPDFDLHGGPIWWRTTVLAWARRTGRIT